MAIETSGGKQINIMGILMGVVIVLALFFGAYFLFFQRPEFIEIVLPGHLEAVDAVSTITFQPERVFESPKFKALRQYGSDITPPSSGRVNPFAL